MTRAAIVLHATASVLLGLISVPATAAPATKTAVTQSSRPSLADTLPLAGRVTDAAHILTPNAIADLAEVLARIERRTKHQVIVVTVPTLDGEDIGSFTTHLGRRWGIGRRKFNDGIILLVAPTDHKVRIAVGYGLQAKMTDRRCAAILTDDVLPLFRAGRLADGIAAGVRRIAAAIDPGGHYP